MIADWPVRFLPPVNALVEEALTQAVEMAVNGTFAPVFSAEHLATIALQTGRAKDKARLLQFIEANALNRQSFPAILQRHQLTGVWQRFQQQFLGEQS